MTPLLSIEGLHTTIRVPGSNGGREHGEVGVVDGVDLVLDAGRTLALVGESGCGKSMLSLAIMGLLPPVARIASGRILLDGLDLASLPASALRAIRGRRVAMIFQDPMTSLNPVLSVGAQIMEAIRVHVPGLDRRALRARAIATMEKARIPNAAARVDAYPHQLSGGLRQRVMIAMALACGPELLIADEPTTALDVTVQAQILGLLRDLQRETGMALLLITHDLGVVAEMADEVAVMYAGRVMEQAPVSAIFDDPQHPYTLGLLGCTPALAMNAGRQRAIAGGVPPLASMPPGCRFHPRCAAALPDCARARPMPRRLGERHLAACLRSPLEASVPAARP
ncbi:ABC transporter ATP-binding protein [Gluconacetobacter liquefaciens]|uniref:ABC transporter ATP-binding protein n=1 Tax=Gluconacetobacter liquefaciens TaxID=89584 RepID=A0A370G792_GLULI|nr:ABC transporter ATP-binding protein [Gluconacetobacter liquefaciens]MBB2185860.1 ABC transporter ATP-binding protein [Gluconacetobacter liquefaciens]RDI39672.1 oligopeptide/dipeptide ABC transporter ATP-binding protein [Gluconacetobacter liquefaciens]GEB36310.1 ABC transporter ATP-binding protein [Gluconacetobacter liquefaciens]